MEKETRLCHLTYFFGCSNIKFCLYDFLAPELFVFLLSYFFVISRCIKNYYTDDYQALLSYLASWQLSPEFMHDL